MFSLLLGLMFTGMSLGPTIGSVLINRTHKVLSVFYIATGSHVFYACLIWFIVPESLAPMQMQQARKLYDDALRAASVTKKKALFKRVFSFLEPLALLLPGSTGPSQGGNPLKKQRKDWSLFLLALAHGCVLLLIVSSPNTPPVRAHITAYLDVGRDHFKVTIYDTHVWMEL